MLCAKWVTALLLLAAGMAHGGESFTFVQLCDPQLGAGGLAHDTDTLGKAVAQINALKPAFVVFCGDYTETPGDEAATRAFNEIAAGLAMPYHLVPGNHDVGPGSVRTSVGQYKRRYGADRFSVDHGGWRFVGVNTALWVHEDARATAEQDAWFEEALREGKARGLHLAVAQHVPPFVLTPGEADGYGNLPLARRTWLLGVLREHGVRLLLAGHVHANLRHRHGETVIAMTASTSINRDNAPMGFRLWTAHEDGTLEDRYVAVEGAAPPPEQAGLARSTVSEMLQKLLP